MARGQWVAQNVRFVMNFGDAQMEQLKRVGLSFRPLQPSMPRGPRNRSRAQPRLPNFKEAWSLDVTSHTLYDHECCSLDLDRMEKDVLERTDDRSTV